MHLLRAAAATVGAPCCWQPPPPEPQHTGQPPASAECCQGALWAPDRRCWVLHMQVRAQSLCGGSPDVVHGCAGSASCMEPHSMAHCQCAEAAQMCCTGYASCIGPQNTVHCCSSRPFKRCISMLAPAHAWHTQSVCRSSLDLLDAWVAMYPAGGTSSLKD